VDNPTKRLELEKEVSEKGYTVAEVRKIVKELKAPAVKEKKKEEVKKATEERDTALRYFTRLRTSTGDILESLKHSLALKEKYVTMTETAEITSEEDFQEIVKILEDIAATGRRMNELLTRTVIPMSDLFTEEEEEAKSA
jgi:DNA-binding transcriptional MerR regulator